jgi:uncharacterized protein (DUF305 family)
VASLLTACGGSSDSASNSQPQTVDSAAAGTTEAAGDFNDDDVMFAQMMIPHHEQAIEMADIALDPAIGASEAIKDLATRIKAAQDPEIATMKDFLANWGAPLTPDDVMDHGSMMEGMLSVEELDELAGLTGPAFDSRWAEAMIAHHKGAVTMANEVLAGGVNPATKKLAEEIIATQQSEIDELTPIAGS